MQKPEVVDHADDEWEQWKEVEKDESFVSLIN